jgi:hypothetical protein
MGWLDLLLAAFAVLMIRTGLAEWVSLHLTH